MKDRLFTALRKSTADYADIRYELEDSTTLCYRGRMLDTLASSMLRGGVARACTRGGWGIATFDSLNDLDRSLAEACAAAALVGQGRTELADVPITDAVVPARMRRDFRGVALDEKLRLVQCYNDIILKTDPAIESTQVVYSDVFRTVHFASSSGTYYCEERPRVGIGLLGTARQGDLVQQTLENARSITNYDDLLGLEALAHKVGSRAVALLKAPAIEGGVHTAVLDPGLGGLFAHEAFGHLSEGDSLYENVRMRELMHLGRRMGVRQLNIVDDGTLAGLSGSQTFDDEGTPMGRTYLIKEGVLVGHLHSRETAGKMGEKATGNARAINRTFRPIVRMTNTYIESGDLPLEALIGDVDKGVYACGRWGGETMAEQFTFSAGYGYRIEKGQVGELVRDVVLTGNVFRTLDCIDGFGNDLGRLNGNCGKGPQKPLPVTFGSPHLRIRDVVIGGKGGKA